MSALAGLAIRALGLFGVTLSPFLAHLIIFTLAAGAIGGVALKIYNDGYASAEQKCEAAALRARVAELQTQLKNATESAARARKVIADLQDTDAENAERLSRLQGEVAAAKLQSTQPGAKRDANALLDDRCNLTERGARRLRGE